MQGLHPRTQQKSRRLKEEPHMHRQRKHRTYGVSAVCRKSAGIEKHMVIVRRIQSLVVLQRNTPKKRKGCLFLIRCLYCQQSSIGQESRITSALSRTDCGLPYKSRGTLSMWFRKQKANKEERHSRKNQEAQRSKAELSSLEKAKQEYNLWVLAEEYEEYER